MAVKRPAPAPLSRVDVLLFGVGLAAGAFAAAVGVAAVFYSGGCVAPDDAMKLFAAIACTGLGLAVYGVVRRRRIVSGLGLIFTALAPAGPAWLAGMLSALLGVILIVRAATFVDQLFDRERLTGEDGEDAGDAD